MELSTTATADARRARRKPTYVPDDPLLTAAEAAAERGQALSTFWRDVRAGACRRPTTCRRGARGGAGRNCARRLEACRAPAKAAGDRYRWRGRHNDRTLRIPSPSSERTAAGSRS